AAELESPGAWQAEVRGVDGVIHLAGEPIGQRWDARVKQRIRDSRVESTRYLVEAIAALPAAERPRVLVSASGVDYYPFAIDTAGFDDDDVTEADPPGDSFLARVCRDWEAEAQLAEPHDVRVVRMRTGLVLDRGGPLARLAGPFKFFVGGKLGSGEQWVSWIHRADVVAAYLAALDEAAWHGPVNLVAPEAVRARGLARAIGHALHRPSWMPVPGFAVRLVAGEAAAYLLAGRKVVPRALLAHAFKYQHPDLAGALAASL
ncbi:MAG: TIGR01777 family oxidoreductase, partial [Myxococcales bacterium]|nr:TIGR01777 family oxidoreductase [Myxococcales bacterium]